MNKKFLGLNEKSRFEKHLKKSTCNFLNCKAYAINSHSYPMSFLRKNPPIYCIDMIKESKSVVDENIRGFITKKSIKNSGVLPLFCRNHDQNVFSRIENKNQSVDIQTYLYLYSYRFFIYDYYMESYARETIKPENDLDENLIKKLEKGELHNYVMSMNIVAKILNNQYNIENLNIVKEKFDRIFCKQKEPTSSDFQESFNLKYYELNITSDFFASGIMHFKSGDSNNDSKPLVSIFSLIPDLAAEKFYFTIVTPKEEMKNINPLIDYLNSEYEKYQRKEENDFLYLVVFLLLDASQNIFLTDNLYSEKIVNKLEELYSLLVYARIERELSIKVRLHVYEEIKNLKIISKK